LIIINIVFIIDLSFSSRAIIWVCEFWDASHAIYCWIWLMAQGFWSRNFI
jgi:hypothetical protein